jgi:hypothetical protein
MQEPLSFKNSLVPLIAGAAVGLFVLLFLRVAYYALMGIQSNMHPGIAFYFSPIIFAVLLIVALPLEALLRQFFFVPTSRTQAFVIGSTHASVLSVWAFPPYWTVVILLNPILLRWVVAITYRSRRTH